MSHSGSVAMDNPTLYEECRKVAIRKSPIAVTLLEFLRWEAEGEKVLDYGCGPGVVGNEFLLPHLEKWNGKLYSVDCSEQMIQHAKQTYPHERITYEVGDIMDEKAWPHESVEFDKIFCHLVLHFVKDTQKILHRFYTNLAPNGQLALAFATRSIYWKCHQHFGRHERWGRFMTGFEVYVPAIFEQDLDAEVEMGKQLAKAGFTIVAMGTERLPYTLNLDTAIDFYWSLYPFTTKVPAEEHPEFKHHIGLLLQQLCEVNEGECTELFYAVVEKK